MSLVFTQVIHSNDHFVKVVSTTGTLGNSVHLFSKGAAISTTGTTLVMSQHGINIEFDITEITTIGGNAPATTVSGVVDQLYPLLET